MHVTVGGTLGAWVHDFLKSCLDMLTGFDLEAQSCHLKTVRIMLPFSGMEGGTPVAFFSLRRNVLAESLGRSLPLLSAYVGVPL